MNYLIQLLAPLAPINKLGGVYFPLGDVVLAVIALLTALIILSTVINSGKISKVEIYLSVTGLLFLLAGCLAGVAGILQALATVSNLFFFLALLRLRDNQFDNVVKGFLIISWLALSYSLAVSQQGWNVSPLGPPSVTYASVLMPALLLKKGRFISMAGLGLAWIAKARTLVGGLIIGAAVAMIPIRMRFYLLLFVFCGAVYVLYELNIQSDDWLQLTSVFSGRPGIWEAQIRIFMERCNFLIGCGPTYSDKFVDDYIKLGFFSNMKIKEANVHNTYLGLAIDYGVAGVLLVVTFFREILFAMKNDQRIILTVAILVSLVILMVKAASAPVVALTIAAVVRSRLKKKMSSC